MKRMTYFQVFTAIFLLFATACNKPKPNSDDVLHPADLRCEWLTNPQGIDVEHPALSWISTSEQRAQVQTAYQIIVSTSMNNLTKDIGDLWDSGKVLSDSSNQIVYAGAPLKSNMQCFWKVKVWDRDDRESAWSEPAGWTMGLLSQSDWKAQWVGLDKASLRDDIRGPHRRLSARYLRKTFAPARQVSRAMAYVCGLGLFEFYVNGQKIGDQVLAPAGTEYNKRAFYMSFDVTSQLKADTNAIGIILGNGRFFAMRDKNMTHYGFPKLLFQMHLEYADGSVDTIFSDESWKITADGPIVANSEYDGEEYDATKEMPGWNEATFDDSKWLNAQITTAPCQQVDAQMSEPIRVTETLAAKSVKEITPGVWVVDMGQNMVGWARLRVKGERGTKVQMRFAEILKDDGSLYLDNIRSAKVTDIYTLKGEGEEFYEPRFTYHGFRYIEVTGYPGPLEASAIEGKVVHDDVRQTGTFETSHPLVNQIYENAVWGIRGNYRSFPTDCPQRDERQGWLGDRATGSRGESYVFDIAALYAKWMGDIRDAQTAEGSIPDVAPSYWAIYNDDVTWPVTYIICNKMLYDQYGNVRLLREHYPAMKKWITYMTSKYVSNNIIAKDAYGDWCMPPESLELIHSKDPSRITAGDFLATAFFIHALDIMAQMATTLGESKDYQQFNNKANEMRSHFNAIFFNQAEKYYANNTATANILAIGLGIADSASIPAIMNNVALKIMSENNGHIATGLVGQQWLMRVLSRHGRPEIAYKILTNSTYPSWGYMVEQGATTIWELWNGNTADPAMNSGNHVMLLGDLLIWLYEDLAGIQSAPGTPAFKKLMLKPVPVGDLSYVNASYRSVYGDVVSHWQVSQDTFVWDISIPANTRATVYVPAFAERNVLESGGRAKYAYGLEFKGMKGDYAVYEAGSGTYQFKSLGYKPQNQSQNYTNAPIVSPGDTIVAAPAQIEISMHCHTPEAEIRYTLDGSTPDMNSPVYSTPFKADRYTVVSAKAFRTGYEPSGVVTRVIDIFDPQHNGLNYSYYQGDWMKMPSFEGLHPLKTGTTQSLDPSTLKRREDKYALVYEGFIQIEKTGEYIFSLTSDDGSRLVIENRQIVLNDSIHGMVEVSGKIDLNAGMHPIRIEFFDYQMGEGLRLAWQGPGTRKQPVPWARLFFTTENKPE